MWHNIYVLVKDFIMSIFYIMLTYMYLEFRDVRNYGVEIVKRKIQTM